MCLGGLSCLVHESVAQNPRGSFATRKHVRRQFRHCYNQYARGDGQYVTGKGLTLEVAALASLTSTPKRYIPIDHHTILLYHRRSTLDSPSPHPPKNDNPPPTHSPKRQRLGLLSVREAERGLVVEKTPRYKNTHNAAHTPLRAQPPSTATITAEPPTYRIGRRIQSSTPHWSGNPESRSRRSIWLHAPQERVGSVVKARNETAQHSTAQQSAAQNGVPRARARGGGEGVRTRMINDGSSTIAGCGVRALSTRLVLPRKKRTSNSRVAEGSPAGGGGA